MITYMNHREWLLRYAFFESVVEVAACVGGKSLEEYILPLMIQALSGKTGFSEYFKPT
jgi:phosphoinositide-3-kinase regulatory subunit 4